MLWVLRIPLRCCTSPAPKAASLLSFGNGAGVELETAPTASLTQLLAQIADDARLRLKTPSVRVEGGKQGDTLYMRGVLEAQFAENLEKTLESLFDDGATLHLTDPSVPAPVKLIVKFKADDSAMVP